MNTEKGSVLVETILAIWLALLFLLGTVEIHRAWKKRHGRILEHRNREVLRLRSAKPLPPAGVSFPAHIGFPGDGG